MATAKQLCVTLIIFILGLIVNTIAKSQIPVHKNEDAQSEVQKTFDLLKDGDMKINLGDKKDLIVLLGVTGTGKSTLTQFIAGDTDQLIAINKHGVIVIEDKNNRIGKSTVTSQTIFPELVIENKTGTAFVDCPGWSDTRSPSYDIAANYFVKKVLDHANRVKLLFTVVHSAVKVGNDREGFVNLLQHACTLITNVKKLAHGISVVVTKVDKEYDTDDNDNTSLRSDEVVIGNIAGFMKEVRQDLQETDTSLESNDERRSFVKCAITLLDIFLLRDGKKYKRMGIFRRPIKAGSLSNSSILADGKRNIEAILYNHTKFVDKDKGDFNYTITDKSKNYITDHLNLKLNKKLKTTFTTLANNIEKTFVDEYISSKDLYALRVQLEASSKGLKEITKAKKFSNHLEFIDEIERKMTTFGKDAQETLTDARNDMAYLEFFQRFSKSKGEYFSTVQGANCFTQASELVTNLHSWTQVLLDLYDKQSNYQYQNYTNVYNVNDLVIDGNYEVFNINASNVHMFLREMLASFAQVNLSIVDDGRVQGAALRDLNNVMNLACKQYASSCETFLEASLEELAKKIQTEYFFKCKEDVADFTGMRGLHQMLRIVSTSMKRLTDTNFSSENEFKNEFVKVTKEVGISEQMALIHMENLIKRRQLYKNFTTGNVTHSMSSVWAGILRPAYEYLRELETWYEYILNSHDELIKTSVEVNTDENNATDRWMTRTEQPINEINMLMFLSRLKQLTLIKHDTVLCNKSLFEIVLRDLNMVAKLASHLATHWEHAIVSELAKISSLIEKKYRRQSKYSNDMHSLQNELDLGYNTLRELIECNTENPNEFTEELFSVLQNLRVDTDPDTATRVYDRINNFLLFKGLSMGETMYFNPRKWVSSLFPAKDYLFNHANWYSFLPDLFEKLSGYSFQKDTSKYNVYELHHWGVANKKQGIAIDKKNINTFLQKTDKLKIAGEKFIKVDNLDDVVFRDLNNILTISLKTEPVLSEQNGLLTIEGNFVVLSKYQQVFRQTKYTSIVVNALSTVFIDTDIVRLGEEFQLTIIAPTWDVQGSRKIVLDGLAGQDHKHPAGYGENGMPGNPGSNGGRFLGIGQEFLRGDSLSVSARGGAGGRGQDGGDGDIKLLKLDFDKEVKNICTNIYPKNSNSIRGHDYIIVHEEYEVSNMGGGDGGRGGFGGNAGSIHIINLGTESGVKTDAVQGSEGVGGTGGKGGRSWFQNRKYHLNIRKGGINGCVGSLYKVTNGEKMLKSGQNGRSNRNEKGRQAPHAIRKHLLSSASYINSFKRYAWKNLDSVSTFSPLNTFLESLQKNVKVRSMYEVLSFVEEYKFLNSANNSIGQHIEESIYQTILESVEFYYVNLSPARKVEEKTVVQLVYAASLGRICRAGVMADRSLITDLNEFVNTILKSVLSKAKTSVLELADLNKLKVVDQINNNYKKAIEVQIKEAKTLISNHTLLEIDQIHVDIESHVRELCIESIDRRLAIVEYDRKLQEQVIRQKVFAFLKFVGSILTLCEETAPLGTVITATTSLADALIPSDLSEKDSPTLPDGVQHTIYEIDLVINSQDKKLSNFTSVLNTIDTEIGSDLPQLDRLKDTVGAIKTKLLRSGSRSTAVARDTLSQAFNVAEQGLKYNDKKGKEALRKFRALFYDSDDSLKLIQKYKTSSGFAGLSEAEKKTAQLDIYEEHIHGKVVPLLRNMRESLTSIESKLAGKSRAHLDVSRYQVQQCVRDVKHYMQLVTRGFRAGDKIQRSISKLEESADLIIHIYGQIEIYEDQKRLGDFISAISSVQLPRRHNADSKLKAAEDDLLLAIMSNTIITQYNRALSAFKQQIFPFGNSYPHLRDELSLAAGSNLSELVSDAEKRLHSLITVIAERKSTIQNGLDSIVFKSEFSSDYKSIHPFYTWESSSYDDEIRSFLSGHEVILKADVATTPKSKNAVKISVIHLNIRTTGDEVLQGELNKVLRLFDVQLKHFGNSHYRCGDQFYVISGESQTISYSYENYNSSMTEPIRRNSVYKKIKAGDVSLSPYAMWSLKLVNKTSSFEVLTKYNGNVNLELVGAGQYVSANADVCKEPLDRYYDVYEVLTLIHVNLELVGVGQYVSANADVCKEPLDRYYDVYEV